MKDKNTKNHPSGKDKIEEFFNEKNESLYTKCTECGKDSMITFSKWSGPDGEKIMKRGAKLCPSCFKQLSGINFFEKRTTK